MQKIRVPADVLEFINCIVDGYFNEEIPVKKINIGALKNELIMVCSTFSLEFIGFLWLMDLFSQIIRDQDLRLDKNIKGYMENNFKGLSQEQFKIKYRGVQLRLLAYSIHKMIEDDPKTGIRNIQYSQLQKLWEEWFAANKQKLVSDPKNLNKLQQKFETLHRKVQKYQEIDLDVKVLWILRNSNRKIEDAETLEQLSSQLKLTPQIELDFRDPSSKPVPVIPPQSLTPLVSQPIPISTGNQDLKRILDNSINPKIV